MYNKIYSLQMRMNDLKENYLQFAYKQKILVVAEVTISNYGLML